MLLDWSYFLHFKDRILQYISFIKAVWTTTKVLKHTFYIAIV